MSIELEISKNRKTEIKKSIFELRIHTTQPNDKNPHKLSKPIKQKN